MTKCGDREEIEGARQKARRDEEDGTRGIERQTASASSAAVCIGCIGSSISSEKRLTGLGIVDGQLPACFAFLRMCKYKTRNPVVEGKKPSVVLQGAIRLGSSLYQKISTDLLSKFRSLIITRE